MTITEKEIHAMLPKLAHGVIVQVVKSKYDYRLVNVSLIQTKPRDPNKAQASFTLKLSEDREANLLQLEEIVEKLKSGARTFGFFAP